MKWKLADAKNRLSEVVNRALKEGPQIVSRRDDTVVIIALTDYENLSGKRPSFKEYLMSGPGFKGIDLTRDKSSAREVDL